MIMILILSLFFLAILGLLIKFKILGYFIYLLPYLFRSLGNLSKFQAKKRKSQSVISSEEEAYEILGLSPGDSIEKIEESYRKLMKKNHPDSGGSEYIAKKINSAKEFLIKLK